MELIQIAQAISVGGAAVAVIITVRLFLHRQGEADEARAEERTAFLSRQEDEQKDRAEERAGFLMLVENHLNEQNKALTQVLTKLNGIGDTIRNGVPGSRKD